MSLVSMLICIRSFMIWILEKIKPELGEKCDNEEITYL